MPTLGYWDIRGLAQPIRNLLHYAGEEYEDKHYSITVNADGNYNNESWASVKYTLGLDFPNLPYYIDDGVKLSQSSTILKYVARKHNLAGSTEAERTRIDLAYDEICDIRTAYVRTCYANAEDYPKARENHLKDLPGKLKQMETFLGDNQWVAGKNISYVDFVIFEMLDQMSVYEPGLLKDFPKLAAYADRFRALPAIKKFRESSTFIDHPYNGNTATFK